MNQIPTTGTLHIYSDPIGADVYIDGNRVVDSNGTSMITPVIVTDIPQGGHTIRFSLVNYVDDIVDTSIVGGYESSVYGQLFRISRPARPS